MKPAMLMIINPNAGHSTVKNALMDILALFNTKYEVRVYTTTAPRDTTRIITKEGDRYELIVVSGGDGTLNEAVTGMLALTERTGGEPTLLGYIPAGTVNDVAFSLGLSLNPVEAARDILEGREFRMDAGTFNGRPYTYVAAFGAFTKVSYATPSESKHTLGKLAYLLEGAKSLGDIKPIPAKVTVNGETKEGEFLLGAFCNTNSMGGFHSEKTLQLDVSLNDGVHEVMFVRSPANIADLASYAPEALRLDFSNEKHFLASHAKELRVEFPEPIAWTVDGEEGGSCTVAELKNLPGAIRILVPQKRAL